MLVISMSFAGCGSVPSDPPAPVLRNVDVERVVPDEAKTPCAEPTLPANGTRAAARIALARTGVDLIACEGKRKLAVGALK